MRKTITWLVVLGVVVVVGGAGYVWFSGGSGEPSTEVTAAPVAGDGDAADGPEAGGNQVVFEIDRTQSSVSFTLDEVLRGAPTVVVGTTSEVAGQVLVDFDDPAASQLGEIVVNARTFTTGNSFRDRAVRGPILNSSSDEFEFASFVPIAIDGLPGSVAVGDTLALTLTGDFSVAGVTNPVTFDVSLEIVSETEIRGSGTASVTRADYSLTIPDAPGVADVSDAVALAIEFVALAP